MNNCLLCNQNINQKINLDFVFSIKPVELSHVCSKCIRKFKKVEGKICHYCSRPMAVNKCQDCNRWNDDFVNHSLYEYNAEMKQYFSDYKFQGDYWLRKVFQQEFSEFLIKSIKKEEIIVPIPVDQSTWKQRGFNQVIGLIENLDYQDILISHRTAKQKHQFQNNRAKRLMNVNQFSLKNNNIILPQSAIIVDDIYTTGTTIRHVRDCLKQNGVQYIRSFTLCR